MQRCPTCNQTYPDEAPGFCPHDGSRLVRDDASSFDPQKTVMGATPPSGGLAPQPPPPPPQPSYNQPPPQWTPQPPQGWPPPPPQNWGGYQQQPPPGQYPPYAMPYPQVGGKRKILSILSIVFGGLTALMLVLMLTEAIERKYSYSYSSGGSGYSYRYRKDEYVIIGLIVTGLGVTALVLGIIGLTKALKDPARYGGKELAIAGMATGVVGAIVALVSAFA